MNEKGEKTEEKEEIEVKRVKYSKCKRGKTKSKRVGEESILAYCGKGGKYCL